MAAPALCHFKSFSLSSPGDPPFLSSTKGTHLSPCLPPHPSIFLIVLPKARVVGPHRGLQREEVVLEGGSGLPHTLGFCSYPRLVGKWSQVDPIQKPRAWCQVFCRGRQRRVQASGVMRLFHQPLDNPGLTPPSPSPPPVPPGCEPVEWGEALGNLCLADEAPEAKNARGEGFIERIQSV